MFTINAGGKGSFEKVLQTLSFPSKIPKTVITTVAKDNFDDLENIFHLCLDTGVVYWSVQLSLPAGRMPKRGFIGKEKIYSLADFIYNCQQEKGNKLEIAADDCFAYEHPVRLKYPWQGCPAGKRLIAIFADGSVSGCPTMDYNVCGNIRTEAISDIWQTKMDSIREPIPSCRICNKCAGGCKAVNWLFGKQFCA